MRYNGLTFPSGFRPRAREYHYRKSTLPLRAILDSTLFKLNLPCQAFIIGTPQSQKGGSCKDYLERENTVRCHRELSAAAPDGWDTLVKFKEDNIPFSSWRSWDSSLRSRARRLLRQVQKQGYFPIRNVEGKVIGFGGGG
jgi:hypothetical protein